MPGFCELKLHYSKLSSTILTEMNKFRQQDLFCDGTLVVDEQHFPIHKLVLSAASDYFKALFSTDMVESKSSQIVLSGVPVHSFKEVLNFIYTNEITLNKENITNICTTADMLQVSHLRNLCFDCLIHQLCSTNCIGIWKYGNMLGNTRLTDIVEWYIGTNFTQVKESCEYKEMSSAEQSDLNSASIAHYQQQPPSLVVAGGFNAGMVQTCERYCETTASWEYTEWALSGFEYFYWVGVIGLRLFAIGGKRLIQTNLVLSKPTERAARHLQTPVFDKDWECETTLPHHCCDMQFCVLNDCIYACGEETTGDKFGICRYSPSDGSWEKIADLHTNSKVFFQFFPHRNKLCILGGLLTMNELATNVFELYDLHSNKLDSAAEMIIPRYSFGVGLIGECIFAVGGKGSSDISDIMLDSVEMYSFDTHKWTFVSSLPAPKASMVCKGWNGALYCFGGEDSNYSPTSEVLKYSHLNDEWTELSPLNTPRLDASIVSL